MESVITVKNEYNSLDKLYQFLKNETLHQCTKEYDIWEVRTDANNQIEQCIVLKKSGMNAMKLFFIDKNSVKTNHIIPNKLMHAYFGKSVKARRNIIEIITGEIKKALLADSQKKAFQELEKVLEKVKV